MEPQRGQRVRLPIAAARSIAQRAMSSVGFNTTECEILADHVIDAALCGYEYSGLPKLLNLIDHPNFKLPRRPTEVIKDSGSTLYLDGGNQDGMIGLHAVTQTLIERTRSHALAMVGVRNMWMSGRSAFFVEMAARAGLVGILTVAAPPTVAPLGGAKPVLGTNPIAFGFPMAPDPVIIDLGTSALMGTDLQFRSRLGIALPQGVAIDRLGAPTTDPAAARQGALLPFSGHKGYALGLAMHALGMLCRSDPGNTSYLFIAFKPDVFADAGYSELLSLEIQRIRATPLREGFSNIRIPGERAQQERARRMREGIEVDRPVYEELMKLAESHPATVRGIMLMKGSQV